MTRDEIEQIVLAPEETLRVELKRSMPWSDILTKAKVTKASLALANTRDGGVLLFGFEENQSGNFQATGVPPADAAAFNTDDVKSFVNAHCAPPVALTVSVLTIEGRQFVAVVVDEFSDYPALCTKSIQLTGQKSFLIREGAIYCRSRVKNSSTELQSPDDLRELVQLASEKEMRRYFRLRSAEQVAGPTDAQRFAAELPEWNR